MAEFDAKDDSEKVKIQNKTQNWESAVTTVLGVASTEQPVFIQFLEEGDQQKYKVIKLDVRTLPDQEEIHWVNNFAIVDSAGNPVLGEVPYTLFLTEPAPDEPASFVYYADGHLWQDKTPTQEGSKPPQPGLLQVDLTRGDPGPGWRSGTE
jgi:hypothetical protein